MIRCLDYWQDQNVECPTSTRTAVLPNWFNVCLPHAHICWFGWRLAEHVTNSSPPSISSTIRCLIRHQMLRWERLRKTCTCTAVQDLGSALNNRSRSLYLTELKHTFWLTSRIIDCPVNPFLTGPTVWADVFCTLSTCWFNLYPGSQCDDSCRRQNTQANGAHSARGMWRSSFLKGTWASICRSGRACQEKPKLPLRIVPHGPKCKLHPQSFLGNLPLASWSLP